MTTSKKRYTTRTQAPVLLFLLLFALTATSLSAITLHRYTRDVPRHPHMHSNHTPTHPQHAWTYLFSIRT